MPKPPNDEPNPLRDELESRRSVLQILGEKTGFASKVLLSDAGSEAGASPIVDPGSATAKLVPQGRGNYQLLGEIARGGMGVILKGHDTDLGRDIAVKVLSKEMAARPSVVQRFIEEAQIGGQLQHPGIVPVYELGLMADDCPYFTMKLVKGRTLAALLSKRKAPTEDRGKLLAIFESVCQTMAYAHSKGVLHRDLKPANVMVGAFGEVQVVDWGLAKVLRRGGVADEKRAKETIHTIIETVRSGPGSSGSDSMVGSVMGTPAYMAPEQAQGEVEKLDERADVFSLGAILCELLTGRPPYEEGLGSGTADSVVVQAGRAMLDPARARIEACDADPALKRLCLECMSPARTARPANAEEVAKAIHDYLSSVEQRAQKAELAAEKARIKAAEERRARRLTVALAGTAAVAVILGGGGFWWVNHERAQRVEQTRVAFESAQGDAVELGRAGKPAEALLAARRALQVAESGGADAAMLKRARNFVAQAESDLTASERERALHEQDTALLARLVDLRLRQMEHLGELAFERELDGVYSQAFRDYGVDLEGADVVPALERLRERAVAEQVALGLDDWTRLRRRVHGAQSEKVENLLFLAMDLDPDAERTRLRQAIKDNDLATMLDLAAPEKLGKLGPGSIFVLSAELWDRHFEHRPDVYRMYDQALQLYPGDYVLQYVGGNIYQDAGRFQAALAARNAALSLRPGDVRTRMFIGQTQWSLGRLTEAEGVYRACIATLPSDPEPRYNLALLLLQLGDHAGAYASIARSFELHDTPDWRPDLLAIRYYVGQASKEELLRALATETLPLGIATYLYPLVDHPDPAKRDAEFTLKTVLELSKSQDLSDWNYLVEAVARYRLEDWSGALAAVQGRFRSPNALILTPSAWDFLRSAIYGHLGRADEARDYYARGMVEWKLQTGGNPAAWERSDVMRWRREAEAVLPK